MAKGYVLDAALLAAIRRVVHEVLSRIWNKPNGRPNAGHNERLVIRRFELLEDLDGFENHSTRAKFLFRDEINGAFITSESREEDEFDLWNPFEIFTGETGNRGYAALFIDGPESRWEILQLQCRLP